MHIPTHTPKKTQAPLLFTATPSMPVATAFGLLGWFALILLGVTALDAVRRRAFEFFKVRWLYVFIYYMYNM
jgi:hypothetical protein